MRKKITANIKLASYDELFNTTKEDLADSSESQVVEIPIEDLYEFKNHPFKVIDDEKMYELVDSVKDKGVIDAIKVRVRPEGGYEIISGHRRRRACELAELKTIPAEILNLSDEEATIYMVDLNIQREKLLISEKARAYAMKYHAQKHQGVKGNTLDALKKESGDSPKTIQRLVYLARLSDELLGYVDEKKLGLGQGLDISFLKPEEQAWVWEIISINGLAMTPKQSGELKRKSLEGTLTRDAVLEILQIHIGINSKRKFSLNEKKLSEYFDDNYTDDDINKIIVSLLEAWKKGQE